MRRTQFGTWLTAAALALAGTAAPAADPHDHGGPAHAPTAHDREIDTALEKGGFQGDKEAAHKVVIALERGGVEIHRKSDILAFTADLGVWTLVVFLLLLFVLSQTAWKPILAGLNEREQFIANAKAAAQSASEEARKVRDELQAKLSAAGDEIRGLLDQARKDAEKVREGIVAQARTEAHNERDRALRDIDAARDAALQSITERSVDLAAMISAKAIRRSISGDDHRRLVDEALAEMKLTAPEGRA